MTVTPRDRREESGVRPGLLLVASAVAAASFAVAVTWRNWSRFSTSPDVADLLTGMAMLVCGTLVGRQAVGRRPAWLMVIAGFMWFLPDLAHLVEQPWRRAFAGATLAHVGLVGAALAVSAPRRRPRWLSRTALVAAAVAACSGWTGGWRVALPAFGVLLAWLGESAIPLRRRHQDLWLAAVAVFSSELIGAAFVRAIDTAVAAERWLIAWHQLAVLATVALLVMAGAGVAPLGAIDLEFDTALDFERAVGDALGSQTVSVRLSDGRGGWLDAVGGSVRPDVESGWVVEDEEGAPLAKIVGGSPPTSVPAHLRRALLLARDHAILRATVSAHVEQLASSRRRILEAHDRARTEVRTALERGPLVRLARIERELADSDDGGQLLSRAQRARRGLERLSEGLDPAAEGASLEEAIRDLAEHSAVAVQLSYRGRATVEATIARTVWFTVSEALANVAKHAPGAAVEVEIDVAVDATRDTVVATVVDNGPGGADLSGSGLRGLADRADVQGGSLRVSSPPGGGTRVELTL